MWTHGYENKTKTKEDMKLQGGARGIERDQGLMCQNTLYTRMEISSE